MTTQISKIQVILSLVPKAQVLVRGDGLDAEVEWYEPKQCPITDQQIADEYERLTNLAKLEDCKSKAKQLIAATDWAVLPDVNISNRADFEAYRATLRNLILNPVVDPVFPVEPQPIWN